MVKSRIVILKEWEKSSTREFCIEHYDEQDKEWKVVLRFAQNDNGEFGYGHRIPSLNNKVKDCWYISERVLRWIQSFDGTKWMYNNDTKTFRKTPLYKGFAKSPVTFEEDHITKLFKPSRNIFSIKDKKNNPTYVWGNTARILEYNE